MNNFQNDKVINNTETDGLDTDEGLEIDEGLEPQSYSLKEEVKRVVHFYKEQPSILIIVLLITYLIYYSFKGNHIVSLKNVTTLNMKGGYDEEMQHLRNSIFELLINTRLWNKLKQQHNYDNGIMNKISVIFGYIFLGFIVRPIKAFFFVIMVLIGISGSFLFPFLVFGVMLYYVFKKVLVNKKPNIGLN